MFKFLFRPKPCPIGVDLSSDRIKLVQLQRTDRNTVLVAGASKDRPISIDPNSGQWQRWVIEVLKEQKVNGKFIGREIVASIPANDVFIDHMKMPNGDKSKAEDILLSNVKQKLTFNPDDAVLKYVPTEDDNVIVMVTEKEKVNRHLAVYEQVNLQVKSICPWPMALINTYIRFFGRRKSDMDSLVLLLEMEPKSCNVVICRHLNLLFAKSVSIGTEELGDERAFQRFMLELIGCKRHFSSMYKKSIIERMIFLTPPSHSVSIGSVYAKIAKQMEMPGQMGDCLAAVEIPNDGSPEIDRRGCDFNWATAFGLSLSANN